MAKKRTKPDGDRKKANALLLSCMDLRMIDETAWLMQELGLHNKYDHVAIAGAALGVLTASCDLGDIQHFGKTFWTHVDLAIALHEIDKVIIVEHGECGAYGAFLANGKLHAPPGLTPAEPPDLCRRPPNGDLATETAQHNWYANELKRLIRARYADTYVPEGGKPGGLDVEVYLVSPWTELKPIG